MKALKELLKYKQSIIDDARNNGHFPWLQDVDEAISEYEALQQHIKDLEEENKKGFQALHCPSCQGGGCPMCGGSGFVFGRIIEPQLSINSSKPTHEGHKNDKASIS